METLHILGVVFDRCLSFFKHADHLREKVELLSMKALAQAQGGLRPIEMTRFYQLVMLPALTYALAIWWNDKPDCWLSARVASVQRTVLVSMLGAFRTTRTPLQKKLQSFCRNLTDLESPGMQKM